MLAQVISTILLANFTFAGANSQTLQIAAGNNAKVKGSILSRNGDLVRIRESVGRHRCRQHHRQYQD